MIYAAIGSAGMFFLLVAGILFLKFWPPTAYVMTLVIAWGIGLTITVGAKMILTMFCGKNYWKGFYRRRPAASNISSLAFECWHLGLAGGVLASRLCQFLLAAAFWIGRIDSKFLSDDVEAFGYRFDTVPQKYFTELLVHDAHRHPFIERLAAMYLMRLKHGEYFSNDAGAQWRVVFVLTLMPWLVKFSQERDHGDGDDESDESGDGADWQLDDDSKELAASSGRDTVKVSGNVPRRNSMASDEDSFSSVASDAVVNGDGDDIDGEDKDEDGRPGKKLSWERFASAKSFGDDVGASSVRSASWNQFASARAFGNE